MLFYSGGLFALFLAEGRIPEGRDVRLEPAQLDGEEIVLLQRIGEFFFVLADQGTDLIEIEQMPAVADQGDIPLFHPLFFRFAVGGLVPHTHFLRRAKHVFRVRAEQAGDFFGRDPLKHAQKEGLPIGRHVRSRPALLGKRGEGGEFGMVRHENPPLPRAGSRG